MIIDSETDLIDNLPTSDVIDHDPEWKKHPIFGEEGAGRWYRRSCQDIYGDEKIDRILAIATSVYEKYVTALERNFQEMDSPSQDTVEFVESFREQETAESYERIILTLGAAERIEYLESTASELDKEIEDTKDSPKAAELQRDRWNQKREVVLAMMAMYYPRTSREGNITSESFAALPVLFAAADPRLQEIQPPFSVDKYIPYAEECGQAYLLRLPVSRNQLKELIKKVVPEESRLFRAAAFVVPGDGKKLVVVPEDVGDYELTHERTHIDYSGLLLGQLGTILNEVLTDVLAMYPEEISEKTLTLEELKTRCGQSHNGDFRYRLPAEWIIEQLEEKAGENAEEIFYAFVDHYKYRTYETAIALMSKLSGSFSLSEILDLYISNFSYLSDGDKQYQHAWF